MSWNWDLFFEIIASISIIIASWVAINGINSWRREARWKNKYEIAENALSLFYEAQEAIEWIRFPGSFTGEGSSREKDESETEEEEKRLNLAYVPIERLSKHEHVFIKLKSLKYRFMSIFGTLSNNPFTEIDKIRNELVFAANQLGYRYWNPDHTRRFNVMPKKNVQFEEETREKMERTIWKSYIDEDEIQLRLDKVIENIESICKKILQNNT